MNNKKISLVSASIMIVVAIVTVYFYFTPISKKIDIVVIGVQFRMTGPPEDYELKEITINGTAKYYLFGNRTDYYEGWFMIEGYDYTFSRFAATGLRNECALINPNPLWYPGPPPLNILGLISTTKNLEEFIIYVHETDENDRVTLDCETCLIICAPAINREDALKLLNCPP